MADSSVDISMDDILVDYPNSFDRYVFYRGSDQQPVHTITWDDLVYPILSQKGKPAGIATLDSSGKVPLAQLPDIGTESYVFQYKVPSETPENFYTTNKTAIDAFAASVIKGGRPSCSLAYTALSVGVKVTIYYDVQILQNSNSANITFKAVSVYSNTDGVISWSNVSGRIQVGNINDIPNSTSIQSITPNLESVKIATTIDYTSMTEQAVPGMKYPNQNGVNDTVYYRTFRISGEVDADGNFYATLASNIGAKTVLYTIGALNWIDKSWANIPIPYAYFHSVGTLSSTIEASSVHITSSGAINLNIACPPAAAGFGLNVRVTVFYMKS